MTTLTTYFMSIEICEEVVIRQVDPIFHLISLGYNPEAEMIIILNIQKEKIIGKRIFDLK